VGQKWLLLVLIGWWGLTWLLLADGLNTAQKVPPLAQCALAQKGGGGAMQKGWICFKEGWICYESFNLHYVAGYAYLLTTFILYNSGTLGCS
jgi:hypothetical protein